MHKRAKTTKSRLNKDENDKRDEDVGYIFIEDNSNVNKRINSFQSRIDERTEREKNRETEIIEKFKNLEDRETIHNDNGESKKKQDK
eukprot:12614762-Heterocapsa_arctica.AAC.1